MNPCQCGGEVYIYYEMDHKGKLKLFAVCKKCGVIYQLMADNRADAEKEWNEIVSNFGGE